MSILTPDTVILNIISILALKLVHQMILMQQDMQKPEPQRILVGQGDLKILKYQHCLCHYCILSAGRCHILWDCVCAGGCHFLLSGCPSMLLWMC